MKAIEVNVVFVDDDGKTYVHTYKPPSGAILNTMAAIEAARAIGCAPPTGFGPELRKVTEVRGRYAFRGDDGEDIVSWDRVYFHLRDLLPWECSLTVGEDDGDECGPVMTYRITAEVVPVKGGAS